MADFEHLRRGLSTEALERAALTAEHLRSAYDQARARWPEPNVLPNFAGDRARVEAEAQRVAFVRGAEWMMERLDALGSQEVDL